MHYDVIIIGAGPGGLECANILAKTNKKVLLLEKNAEIGPKVCAGGLTRKSIEYLKLPNEIGTARLDYIWFGIADQKTKLKAGKNFVCTVNRGELGRMQEKLLAGKSNVTIRTNANVTKIEKNKITINENEEISFDYLVGADGSNSLVRKYLKLETKWAGVGIYYIIENFKQDFEVHFEGKLFNSWYAWIFPYGKTGVTIGTAAFGRILPLFQAKKNLEFWMKKRNIEFRQENFNAHPINCDYRGYRFNNIFLVGDAAGMASPFSGEGIYQSLVSGKVVANQIIDPTYSSREINNLRCVQRMHYFFLLGIWVLGPLRNLLFKFVVFITKNKYIARMLLWTLA